MDAHDAAAKPSSIIPEWCNPSLLAAETQSLLTGGRTDWLKQAMHAWIANAPDSVCTAPTPSTR